MSPFERRVPRRSVLQAGTLGLLGLDMAAWQALQAGDRVQSAEGGSAKAVLFIFLSGGLSQLDSFDMKPNAPQEIRGEFAPIATRTPGVQICEHFPRLAQLSDRWALVRSITHTSNEHNEAHTLMLTGRSVLPPGFNPRRPQPSDWPSISATVGRVTSAHHAGLPAAVVVPQRLVNMNQGGVVTPGQFAGQMGSFHDPWIVEASPYRGNDVKGAYPDYAYRRITEERVEDTTVFSAPKLSLPEGLTDARMRRRMHLLKTLEGQRRKLDQLAGVKKLDQFRQSAISLLTDEKVQRAFDVHDVDDATAGRYGRNLFGWTLLMAKRLIETGVTLVQANLGNYNTWDLHGGIFKLSRRWLYPPADQAISALLEDLHRSGRLAETLVVIAGEFGRTPKIVKVPNAYLTPGRDHWGAVQTAMFAGGGVQGGRVVGASDAHGAFPADRPYRPEDFAATMYSALGIPRSATWHDALGRPHFVYHGRPIAELF